MQFHSLNKNLIAFRNADETLLFQLALYPETPQLAFLCPDYTSLDSRAGNSPQVTEAAAPCPSMSALSHWGS